MSLPTAQEQSRRELRAAALGGGPDSLADSGENPGEPRHSELTHIIHPPLTAAAPCALIPDEGRSSNQQSTEGGEKWN